MNLSFLLTLFFFLLFFDSAYTSESKCAGSSGICCGDQIASTNLGLSEFGAPPIGETLTIQGFEAQTTFTSSCLHSLTLNVIPSNCTYGDSVMIVDIIGHIIQRKTSQQVVDLFSNTVPFAFSHTFHFGDGFTTCDGEMLVVDISIQNNACPQGTPLAMYIVPTYSTPCNIRTHSNMPIPSQLKSFKGAHYVMQTDLLRSHIFTTCNQAIVRFGSYRWTGLYSPIVEFFFSYPEPLYSTHTTLCNVFCFGNDTFISQNCTFYQDYLKVSVNASQCDGPSDPNTIVVEASYRTTSIGLNRHCPTSPCLTQEKKHLLHSGMAYGHLNSFSPPYSLSLN